MIDIYIWVMRGTPCLLQLIFIYYVLPVSGIRLDHLLPATLPSRLIMQPTLLKFSVEELQPFLKGSTKQ